MNDAGSLMWGLFINIHYALMYTAVNWWAIFKITPTVKVFVCLTEISRDKEGGCGGANPELRKQSCCNKTEPHFFELFPWIAPGPVVCFVLPEPHRHQLVPTVVEDLSVKDEKRESSLLRLFPPPGGFVPVYTKATLLSHIRPTRNTIRSRACC